MNKSELARKRIEAMIAEARANGALEESVPFDDQEALARDVSEKDAFLGEYDPAYEAQFYAQRARDLAGDRSETRNLWAKGRR